MHTPTSREHRRKYVARADRPHKFASARWYVHCIARGHNIAPLDTALYDYDFGTSPDESLRTIDRFFGATKVKYFRTISDDRQMFSITSIRGKRFWIER